MTEKFDLTITQAELEELNSCLHHAELSEKLKLKVAHLCGYARHLEKAKKTKAQYDILVTAHE